MRKKHLGKRCSALSSGHHGLTVVKEGNVTVRAGMSYFQPVIRALRVRARLYEQGIPALPKLQRLRVLLEAAAL